MFHQGGAVALSNADGGRGGYYAQAGRGAGASLATTQSSNRRARLRRAKGGRLLNPDRRAFTPLGDFFNVGGSGFVDPTTNFPNFPGGSGGGMPGGSSGGSGGFDWSQIFGVITQAAPAIITAARGQGVPAGYYPAAIQGGQQQGDYVQYQQLPPGYSYQNGQLIQTGSFANAGSQAGAGLANLGNSLATIVTQNPLLILGGTVALLLLFKTPPRR